MYLLYPTKQDQDQDQQEEEEAMYVVYQGKHLGYSSILFPEYVAKLIKTWTWSTDPRGFYTLSLTK